MKAVVACSSADKFILCSFQKHPQQPLHVCAVLLSLFLFNSSVAVALIIVEGVKENWHTDFWTGGK